MVRIIRVSSQVRIRQAFSQVRIRRAFSMKSNRKSDKRYNMIWNARWMSWMIRRLTWTTTSRSLTSTRSPRSPREVSATLITTLLSKFKCKISSSNLELSKAVQIKNNHTRTQHITTCLLTTTICCTSSTRWQRPTLEVLWTTPQPTAARVLALTMIMAHLSLEVNRPGRSDQRSPKRSKPPYQPKDSTSSTQYL